MDTKPSTSIEMNLAPRYTLRLEVTGSAFTDPEAHAGDLLDLVRAAFGLTFMGSFEEHALDYYRHAYEREQEERGKPSDWDLGYEAGKKVAEDITGERDA